MHRLGRALVLLQVLPAALTALALLASGTVAAQESSQPDTYAASTDSRMYPAVLDRLTNAYLRTSKAPQGTVASPAPTFQQQAACFVSALIEEACYRVRSTVAAILGDLNPMQIIDGDWKKVEDTTKLPYKAICHIAPKFRKGSNAPVVLEGTAFFVGPRVLLTNAHNLYRDNVGGWAKEIRIAPGRNGNSEPYESQTVISTFVVAGEWIGTPTNDFDIGWIILPDSTLYDRVGYAFGYKTTTDTFLKGSTLNTAGYPDSSTYKYRMYYDSETKDQAVSPKQFKHWLDTSSGSSGSPLYYIDSKVRYVVGVHCAHSASTNPKDRFNVGTRMTKQYYDWTRDIIKSNP